MLEDLGDPWGRGEYAAAPHQLRKSSGSKGEADKKRPWSVPQAYVHWVQRTSKQTSVQVEPCYSAPTCTWISQTICGISAKP